MTLYHFSDYKFNTIKIKYFGFNSYSKNDSVYPLKRFFCYDVKKPLEYYFNNASYCYEIEIKDKYIYNLDNDKLKLKEKFNFDINKILEYIAKNFDACFYSHSFKCYIVFKNTKVLKRYNLLKLEGLKNEL